MIIDVHCHIFSPVIKENREHYCSTDACFNLLYSHPKAKLCSVEDLIRSMDENEIEVSAILNIGWVKHDNCLRNNDYILESISRYPGRLIGFCAIQPVEREKALEELQRCFKAGIKGVGELRPDLQGYDINDDQLLSPIIEIIDRNNACLSLHASEPVGHIYNGKGDMVPGILYEFIRKHQRTNIILAHFGGGLPFYELMPEVKSILTNTYYDTAAAPFLYHPDIYIALKNICGEGKILFGSDWPLLEQSRVVKHITSAGLSKEYSDKIFANNAHRLFKQIA